MYHHIKIRICGCISHILYAKSFHTHFQFRILKPYIYQCTYKIYTTYFKKKSADELVDPTVRPVNY
jgi:hypothetical protein